MLPLDQLTQKWFIDVTDQQHFPPAVRIPDSALQAYTNGNMVAAVIDGSDIMGDFYFRVQEMLDSSNSEQCQIMVAAMGIEPIKLLGENGGAPDAMAMMLEAAKAGVGVYFLASGQGNLGRSSRDFSQQLIELGGNGAIDRRFPGLTGGHHQKYNIT